MPFGERVVLLLRGVNMGGKMRVPMPAWRETLVRLGYRDVQTYINSGNAVVTLPGPLTDRTPIESAVAASLLAELGVQTEVVLRTCEEVRAVLAANPLAAYATDGARYYVGFLRHDPHSNGIAALAERETAPDRICVLGREVYVWYANGAHRSPLGIALLERTLRAPLTLRNWNTVRALAALVCSG